MSAKILAALRQLDPSNPNHWTADGAARLDSVKLLAGDNTITREAVTAAAPGLSRTTPLTAEGTAPAAAGPATPPDAAAQGASTTQPPAGATGADGESDDKDSGGGNGTTETGGAGAPADAQTQATSQVMEEPEDELELWQHRHAQVLRAKSEIERALVETTANVDRILQAREKGGVVQTLAGSLAGYFASQQRIREARGARMAEMKGIPLKDILPKPAPIDAAFGRRTARDTKRPTKI